MASQEQFLKALAKPYDRLLFAKDVLKPVFGTGFRLEQNLCPAGEEPNKTEKQSIKEVGVYGNIHLDDGRPVTCYEIELQPKVRIEQSKVTIQQYVRKLLTAGQAALVNFVAPDDTTTWRFTLVAKDSEITGDGIKEKLTHAKRYTYVVEANRPNRTLAERLEKLGSAKEQNLDALIEAFSVEKLSKLFFDEYKEHYQNFVEYLTGKRMVKERGKWKEKKTSDPSAFLKSVFNGNEKEARDFCKKLMGRVVFLYFVQRKGWLGASDIHYNDGDPDFIFNLFKASGGSDNFYPNWLSPLFFNTLNNNHRHNEEYELPDGTIVHIPFLNGGLFDKDKVDEKLLTFPASLFHNADNPDSPQKRGFLDFLNAFNFTVYEDSPDDHTVAVDPEMLGHIFENLLEENKEKGAFYTPKEIVHFMCRESLIEYLTTHLEKEYTVYKEMGDKQVQLFGNDGTKGQLKMMEELGDQALDRADVEGIVKEKDIARLTRKQLLRIDKLLEHVKICDPAIGSGAFPMGLLKEIFSMKEMIASELQQEWNPAEVKENIIQHSIYGVDIERGAVDIARLRFWLSLLVDSEEPKPLPNLEYKIVTGNSLVSIFEDEVLQIDWEIKEGTQASMFGHEELLKRQELLKKITETQKAYFHAGAQKKRELALQIRNLKIDLLINQLSLMIQTRGEENKPSGSDRKAKERTERYLNTQKWKRMIQTLEKLRANPDKPFNHFDWKLDFPEVLNEQVAKETGFDIVIGNPPYVQLQKDGGKLSELYKECGFKTFERTGDIYMLFYEKGFHLLGDGGIHTFITSNKWMRAGYGQSLRKYFAENKNMVKLIDLGANVFETATVDTNILIAKNENPESKFVAALSLNETGKGDKFKAINGPYTKLNDISGNSWVVLTPQAQKIKEKVEAQGVFLEDWDLQINRGIVTGYNKAFIINHKKREQLILEDPKSEEILEPMLRGRDVKKYLPDFSNRWVVGTFPARNINIDEYPAIKKYLLSFDKRRLEQDSKTFISEDGKKKKSRKKTSNKWFETQDTIAYWKQFEKPKIIYPNMTKYLPFVYDKRSFYTNQKCFILTGDQLGYLTAFLNSLLFKYVYRDNFPELQGGTRELSKIFFEKLAVKKLHDQNTINKFEGLVSQISETEQNSKQFKSLDEELNEMIFKLYELTEKEIEIVRKFKF